MAARAFNIEEFIINESATGLVRKRGRPAKPFLELSERDKWRTVDGETLDPNVDSIEKSLLLARRTAYKRQDVNVVKVIGHLLKNQNLFPKMYVKLTDKHEFKTPEEAFAFLIESNLSKHQYENIHFDCPSRYPPYDVIKDAKKLCAPSHEFIEGSASKIKVNFKL